MPRRSTRKTTPKMPAGSSNPHTTRIPATRWRSKIARDRAAFARAKAARFTYVALGPTYMPLD